MIKRKVQTPSLRHIFQSYLEPVYKHMGNQNTRNEAFDNITNALSELDFNTDGVNEVFNDYIEYLQFKEENNIAGDASTEQKLLFVNLEYMYDHGFERYKRAAGNFGGDAPVLCRKLRQSLKHPCLWGQGPHGRGGGPRQSGHPASRPAGE